MSQTIVDNSTPPMLPYADPLGTNAYSRSLSILAVITAIATFPLIFMGGLVTSHGAGMSVPDWPNSYGYNMFLFPISQWRGGIFFEHTHRLMATVVGFCSILLTLCAWGSGRNAKVRWFLWLGAILAGTVAALAWISSLLLPVDGFQKMHSELGQYMMGGLGLALVLVCATLMRRREPRRWVRWLATSVLGAVIFQGVLGGLRVVWVDLDLAIVHACVAQAFFCLSVLMAIVVSRWWIAAPDLANSIGYRRGKHLIIVCVIAVVVIYLQLIVGAMMRHDQAGLAVPTLPLAYGQVIPATNAQAMQKINELRAWKLHLPPVTPWQIWLHMGHRIGAVLVTIALTCLIAMTLRKRWPAGGLRPLAGALIALILIQLTLGVLTVAYRKPADIASAHVAFGALTLVTTFALTIRAMRLYAPRHSPIVRPEPSRIAVPGAAVPA